MASTLRVMYCEGLERARVGEEQLLTFLAQVGDYNGAFLEDVLAEFQNEYSKMS
jgi:hypothetical protein